MATKMSLEPNIGEVLHEWSVSEYEQYVRPTGWYIAMILIGVVLVLFGLFSGNFLFSLIIVLFGIILFLQSYQEAPELPFRITEEGVVISDRFYSYNELDSFYIVYSPPAVKNLYLETKSFFKPLLRINLHDINPLDVRHTLQEFLVEDTEKEDEPFADKIGRLWGLH